MKNLDIIIPVKNEEGNILPLLERIHKAMSQASLFYKIIFIDDHSTDKTYKILNNLINKYPIRVYKKEGKLGKAFSIIEGVKYSNAEYVVMLDADLQYPPEAIPEMFAKSKGHGVVVGNRKGYKASFLRKFVSKAFNFGFGRMLHGFKVDVQSGLKLFRKEIFDFIDEKEVTPWTLDLTLLTTARNLGFKITDVDINFDKRTDGKSKVNLIHTSTEIGKNAFKLKFKRNKTYLIKPVQNTTMAGAGFVHNKKWLKTHTTLKPHQSALQSFTPFQVIMALLILLALEAGFIFNPIITLVSIVGLLSLIYGFDVLFNLFVVLKSLHNPPEIVSTEDEIAALKDEDLPTYTILCPLYREAHIIDAFLEAIDKLNYPKNKLDVKLLLEEDDLISIASVKAMKLPRYVSTLIVPDSEPKTKPKACNYGLNFATGEYLVIYDAEDQPEPDQLKKAYLAFKKSKPNVVCLQAKLNYFNSSQNLLTRFFTAEYSLWFDVMLTGLQSVDTIIPLGGTSNHFRTKTLIELEGWDPFNVTEDCDLGVRLFKKGYKTAIIDSTTLEEANSNPKNWIRQRSRWIKGYMQTYLVHMRNPFQFIHEQGPHAFIFQLIIGARISFMLINPILWLTTFSYFAFYAYTSTFIESLYPATVLYLAVFSLVAGNFLYIYNYMIGCAKREQWELIKYVYLVPLYWLMASIAACIALYQLIVKPHYWEKTLHGLHLKKSIDEAAQAIKEEVKEIKTEAPPVIASEILGVPWHKKLSAKVSGGKVVFASAILVLATFISGVSNLGFSVYLGRTINFEDLARVSLITSFVFFAGVPQISLFNTITSRVGFFEGKDKGYLAEGFLYLAAKKAIFTSIILSGVWFAMIPFLMNYFNSEDYLLFLLFTPVWIFGTGFALIKGLLAGKLQLEKVGFLLLVEAIFKFASAFLLIQNGYEDIVYVCLPISIIFSLIFSLIFANKYLQLPKNIDLKGKELSFPFKFFTASALSIMAPVAFLSFDVLLANHYLAPVEAGKYALVSTVGKIIYFVGALSNQLILPFVSRNEGANKNSDKLLLVIFITTFIVTGVGYLFWGQFGSITVPFIFGEKAYEILNYLEPFTFAMMLFCLSQIFVSYYLAKKIYTIPVASFLLVFVQYALIYFNHATVEAIVFDMFIVALLNLVVLSSLHFFAQYVKVFENNLADFLGLFTRTLPFEIDKEGRLRVLIFNWRDIRHVWSGGAENYIHELSKLWVEEGYQVTIFCGNDSKNKRYEVIDGVQIVRRGGFYTVYFWAILYYAFRFRGKYDLIIDSENGIPFFTPFYVRKPKLLLIHHIHQEVFRNHLSWPLATVAGFLEAKLMPFAYRKQKVVTVSDSSKSEILKLGKNYFDSVEIVNPGIHSGNFLTRKKTAYPSFLYLGRLQPYKNIDVAIKAFVEVHTKFPKSILTVAGFGESISYLKKLVEDLKIENAVQFTGKVTEEEKLKLLAESWVMIQPSMIEGWGITVIEANASGTPVIASNVNGLRDSVVDGKTGLLVKPKDVRMFAKAMINLIEDEEFRSELSGQSYKWAQNFSWENSAEKFLSVIKNDVNSDRFKKLVLKGLRVEI